MALSIYDKIYDAIQKGIPMRTLCLKSGLDFQALNAKIRDQTLKLGEAKDISMTITAWEDDLRNADQSATAE